jgi:hypothetical protein
MKFFNKKKEDKYIPEEDYMNYTDPYISQLNNDKNEEEENNEFFQKTT